MLRLTDIAAKGSILLCVYGLFGFGNGIFQISRRNESYGFIYDLSSLEVEKGGNAHTPKRDARSISSSMSTL